MMNNKPTYIFLPPNHVMWFRTKYVLVPFISLLFLLTLFNGCSSRLLAVRRTSLPTLDKQLGIKSPVGIQYSDITRLTLKTYELPGPERASLNVLVQLLDQIKKTPTPELLYTFAELAYIEGARQEKKHPVLAWEIYYATMTVSFHYLFDPEIRNEHNYYDRQYLYVYQLYNHSVEKILRQMFRESEQFTFLPDRNYRFHLGENQYCFQCRLLTGAWTAIEIDSFKFVSDYEIVGLENNKCYQGGIGVPLIAKRKDYITGKKEERFYPPGLCFPVTAILRPETDDKQGHHAVLEFYDPLVISKTKIWNQEVPIASDLTTPLAYYLTNPSAFSLGTVGLIRPDELLNPLPGKTDDNVRPLKGLYMLQPYESAKIPVVMVHGLWSSPMTWMEMFNSLRNIPEIRENYQFWFYFYPSGQPFWVSAAELRHDLQEMSDTLDPNHQEPAFKNMVLIGHSMGGLISRLQVTDSGNHFWRLISDVPLEEIKLNATLKQEIRQWFFFSPNPSIRRVITIATPFEGSHSANDLTEWLAKKMISTPKSITDTLFKLLEVNGSNHRSNLLNVKTSVDSLSPDCEFFQVMDKCEIPESVILNNIVGVIPTLENSVLRPRQSDGVVDFSSSHRDDVESEKKIPAAHMVVHLHPAAILETKRILLEHLKLSRNTPGNWEYKQGPVKEIQPSAPEEMAVTPEEMRQTGKKGI